MTGEFQLRETVELDDQAGLPLPSLAHVQIPRKLLLTASGATPETLKISMET